MKSITQANRSAVCQKYANMGLPPPPGASYIRRRSLDADRLVGQWRVSLTRMGLRNGYFLLALFVIVLLVVWVLIPSVGKTPANGKRRKNSVRESK